MADGFLGLPTVKFNDTELIKESKSVNCINCCDTFNNTYVTTGKPILPESRKKENKQKDRKLRKLKVIMIEAAFTKVVLHSGHQELKVKRKNLKRVKKEKERKSLRAL